MEYKDRIIDKQLDLMLNSFGATLIKGPKGCGKTTSAKHKAKSFIEFQDEDERENLLLIANTKPSNLLDGEKPRLFDEWQDAPKIWGAIRKSVDDTGLNGQYILTGSSSKNITVAHTGTLRIAQLKMYPMSLYETGESNGEISLIKLFDNPDKFNGCKSNITIDDVIFSICRGGWPQSIRNTDKKSQLQIAKSLFKQTYSVDISSIDNVKRNPRIASAIIQSYSRNICTLANNKTIYNDVTSTNDVTETTIRDYIDALERLYIIDDIDAWCPSIRSKTAIRSSKKKNFIDPSIAVAALGLSPEYFNKDFKTLGFLFESLCIRDLKIYSSVLDGDISYYHDRYGLEADAVLHLNDGRYALIEFKLGESQVEEAAKHLNEIENLIKKYNEREKQCPLKEPNLKIIITATQYGYKREDGVMVIPIGCLKD